MKRAFVVAWPLRPLRWVVLLVLLGGLGGCVHEPTMRLHASGIRGVGTSGVLLNITMAVRNDNSFDVMVRNVTTDVTLAGRHRLPTVSFSPNVWLPAGKTTLVTVPVAIPWGEVAPILATTATSSKVSYHAMSVADITATRALEININEYRLSEDGSFSRAELLAAAARGF